MGRSLERNWEVVVDPEFVAYITQGDESMHLNLHFHGPIHLRVDGQALLVQIVNTLEAISTTQEQIMATLDELKAADAAEDVKIDALIAAHGALKAAVADLTAQVEANADNPAKIQELVDAAVAKAAAIDAELAGVVSPPAEPV